MIFVKTILYNAVSVDGFIAGKNDDTDWVSAKDWDFFESLARKTGVLIYGARTYFDIGLVERTLPIQNVLNVVMTNREGQPHKDVEFFSDSPMECLKELEERGFHEVVLAGGGRLNASFYKAGLINEVILSVHPVYLSEGIRLFGDLNEPINLSLYKTEEVANILVRQYYHLG